jgi:hypothetical protein
VTLSTLGFLARNCAFELHVCMWAWVYVRVRAIEREKKRERESVCVCIKFSLCCGECVCM